ncbi:Transcription factor bHLH85 [Hibiscus syriacus]|uniref:Transcription factor bHLH85 n=1 Tax=Hibiscus syriacus TaxID=106335 RepID=A0A6A2Z5R6_HIBSY|nr:Transcription factor bHLH85 [Hibiscus syriacus]
MDSMEAILEDHWSCLSGMYTTDQEADFMAQLLSNCPLTDDGRLELDPGSNTKIPSSFWPVNVDMTMADATVSSCSSDMSSYSPTASSVLFSSSSSSSQERFYLSDSHPVFVADNGTISIYFLTEKKCNNVAENSKKRSRTSSGDIQRTRRNARSKKNVDEDGGNAGLNWQSWASCSSDDDSNASLESNSGSKGNAALNLNGKTRANRGAATDPQSLYSRKRRERINERLRILQNLVPNGTKVDISTMLEEAVQHVKFLQLQIKLLSSNDLWMYAPIAYNGMDIGIDLEVETAKRS